MSLSISTVSVNGVRVSKVADTNSIDESFPPTVTSRVVWGNCDSDMFADD